MLDIMVGGAVLPRVRPRILTVLGCLGMASLTNPETPRGFWSSLVIQVDCFSFDKPDGGPASRAIAPPMRWLLAFAVAALTLGSVIALPGTAHAQQDPPVINQRDLPEPLREPFATLTGPSGDLSDRTAAALEIIAHGGADAPTALAASLGNAYGAQAWHATLDALSTTRETLPVGDLPDVIFAMRSRIPADLEQAWVQALGRYELERIADELETIARNNRATPEQRRLAILALGHHRRAFAAEVLIDLIDVRNNPGVRGWAFEALGALSHQPALGQNAVAWEDWWKQASRYDRTQWQRELHENLLLLTAQQRAQDRQLRERLIQSQRALVSASQPEDRPQVIAGMLSDPLEAIRNLGVSLSRQQLEDGHDIPEALLAALRVALDDDSARIREQAATLLGQLLDTDAAAAMASRLASGRENVASVQRQFLLALSRMPSEGVVEPAYEMLADPALRAEAAAALAAAVEQDLVAAAMMGRIRDRVDQSLEGVSIPQPEIVRLLGQVIEEDDGHWDQIIAWLESGDDQVKDAAARVIAGSDRSLLVLAQRTDDPVIRPIALRAIEQRGSTAVTLASIVQNRPEGAGDLALWESALAALAQRVPIDSLLESLEDLEQMDDTRAVRERMLSAATQREDRPEEPGEFEVKLYLLLAKARNGGDAARLRVTDYEAALPHIDVLGDADQGTLVRGLTEAYLGVGNTQKAFDTAKRVLFDAEGQVLDTASNDPLMPVFIAAADKAIELGQNERAGAIVTGLREMIGAAITPELALQLTRLQNAIDNPPAPPPE